MARHLIRKLEHNARLSSDEQFALEAAIGKPHEFQPREDLIRESDNPDDVNVMLEGWACRYKQLRDGRRQVVSFFMPGDFCDSHMYVPHKNNYSIGALTVARVGKIPCARLRTIAAEYPRVDQALRWEALLSTAIQREWTVSLGRRTANERVGHLFCELFLRLQVIGLTKGNSCFMPLTIMELADSLGLSTVHTNRVLQHLRRTGLILLEGKTLTIVDFDALQAVSQFTPKYLHLNREGHHLDVA